MHNAIQCQLSNKWEIILTCRIYEYYDSSDIINFIKDAMTITIATGINTIDIM